MLSRLHVNQAICLYLFIPSDGLVTVVFPAIGWGKFSDLSDLSDLSQTYQISRDVKISE